MKPVLALFHMPAGDGVALVRAEGDELAAALGIFDDAVCVLGVGIDAADAAGIKNFKLGREIVLKVRVLDGADVVAADVQNAPTSNVMPRTRPYLSAWDDASITRCEMPDS